VTAGSRTSPGHRRLARPLALAVLGAAIVTAAPPALATNAADPLARATWTIAPESRAALIAQAADPAAPAAEAPPASAAAPGPRGPSPASAALRSLVVPGWGQLATGHKTQAGIFFGLEAGSWASFLTFRRQGALRRDAYLETARIYAGIDLESKDDRLRRLVGQWQSNETFNQYVVRREAAYFIEDPAEQQAYIEQNSLGGSESWSWTYFEDFLRYREQRRSSEQAFHNSEFVLGFAIANRLVSAVMAARQASSLRKAQAAASSSSSPLEGTPRPAAPDAGPLPGRPDGHFAWGVAPSAHGPLEGRVGWIVTF
jgi:hypothetical protein